MFSMKGAIQQTPKVNSGLEIITNWGSRQWKKQILSSGF